MPNFLTPKDEFPPIRCRVFEDYDRLDALAEKRGYHATETSSDDDFTHRIGAGAQNGKLHCGWIATMGDENVSEEAQIQLLKDKIAECLKRREEIIIGFCQTGNFSVGYSIYVKRK